MTGPENLAEELEMRGSPLGYTDEGGLAKPWPIRPAECKLLAAALRLAETVGSLDEHPEFRARYLAYRAAVEGAGR